MAAKSIYLRNKILDLVFGRTSYTAPTTVYVGLFTTNPSDTIDSGQEATGINYSRVAVINNTTNWPAASEGVKSNANEIEFPIVGAGGWGLITGYGIFDSSSNGNLLYFGEFNSFISEDGDRIKFNSNAIQIIES